MSFHVGQKVVCVRGIGNPPTGGGHAVEGSHYTIRGVGLTVDGKPGVRVVEFELSSGPGEHGAISGRPFKDAFMYSSRFRPLIERKTDISIFTAMLNPSKQRVRA